MKEMLDDDDSIKEEIKKLEAELAELKADEADDTWTEKVCLFLWWRVDSYRAWGECGCSRPC